MLPPSKPPAAPLSREARDLAEARRRRRQELGIARPTGLRGGRVAIRWRDRLPSRTLWVILGIVVAIHVAVFLVVKDNVALTVTTSVRFIVNFIVKDVPEKVIDGKVVTPGQRNYTVSTDVLELPNGDSRPTPEPAAEMPERGASR